MKKVIDLMLELNELDFKDQKGFKKYTSKHKIKPTTKVTIGGKETTAGDAMKGDDAAKEAPKETPKDNFEDTYTYGSNPEAEEQAYGAVEMLGDVLERTYDTYDRDAMQGELEKLKDTGVTKELAKNLMDAEIKNIESQYDDDEWAEEAYPQNVKDELHSHLDDVYGDFVGQDKAIIKKKVERDDLYNKIIDDFSDEEKRMFGDEYDIDANDPDELKWFLDNLPDDHVDRIKGEIEQSGFGESDYASGFDDSDVPSDEFRDTLDSDDEDNYYGDDYGDDAEPSDKFLNAEDALENGLMDQEEFDDIVSELRDESTGALADTVTSNFYSQFDKDRGREIRGNDIAASMDKYEDAIAHDPEAFVRNLENSIIQKGKGSVRDWNNIKSGNWRTIQAINDKLSDIAPEAPSMSWNNIARELEYDVDDEGNIKGESVKGKLGRIIKEEIVNVIKERGVKKIKGPKGYDYPGYGIGEEHPHDLPPDDKAITEQRPFFQETPNEFAYLDFKKWAYPKRGMIKKALLKALEDNRGNATYLFLALWKIWYEWSRKKAKQWSRIPNRGPDAVKFGRHLAIMMKKDNLVITRAGNKLTTVESKLNERIKDRMDLSTELNHLFGELGIRDNNFQDKIFSLIADKARLKEGRLTEESAMKAIIDAKKGAKASGGGYSPWTKISNNSWKNKKTGRLTHNAGLYDKIGEFSDFVIEGKLNESTSLWKRFDELQKLRSHGMDLEYDMKQILHNIREIMMDMEQEAEPEGGPKADRYGKELDQQQKLYKKRKAEFKKVLAKIDRLEVY